MRAQSFSLPVLALAMGSLAGCIGTPIATEKTARDQVARVGTELRPHAAKPVLPTLRLDSPPAEFIRYAVLNHPAVEAAYHDWRAAVLDITRARSLPDPQLTFEADITDTLMTFMPGVMFDLTAPRKRAALGREAAATSDVAYRAYAATVFRTAAEVRKAWIELAYAQEARGLYMDSVRILEQALALSGADYATGRTMGSLEAQVRLKNQIAEHHTHHLVLTDRLVAAWARFKATLGIAPGDPNPAWPNAKLEATALPDDDELWRRLLARNADLAKMRAMVAMAVAAVETARTSRTPDFSLGAMADLRANPLMVRPTATLTLPVWRDKIAATIGAAEARHAAAVARVSAEQLTLAAELAQTLFMVRDADRMITYIDDTALPNLSRLAASVEAGYQSGSGSAAMITDAQHMPVLMRLERLKALQERENAVVDLLLLTADAAPSDVPLLADAATPPR